MCVCVSMSKFVCVCACTYASIFVSVSVSALNFCECCEFKNINAHIGMFACSSTFCGCMNV